MKKPQGEHSKLEKPNVYLVTSHSRCKLEAFDSERVYDILARCGIPWSAVTIYAVPLDGCEPRATPCLDRSINDFPGVGELLIYYNRNINGQMFSLSQFKTIQADDSSRQSTEYFYQRLDNENSSAEVFLKKLSEEECTQVISKCVRDTILSTVPEGSILVVGVSGGGDSNALLNALHQMPDHRLKVHPVIIKGIPEWDKGVPRALKLCEKYGLPLDIIDEDHVREILQIRPSSTSLVECFEQQFKGDDFEFLGTLLVRLALVNKARELGASYICTGLNLEDILCEALFRITSGMKPAPFPTRVIGDMTIVYPLWLCPKRIIDGCFPKMSLENYDSRYPCFSLGRNLYYSIVFGVQSHFPGYVEQLAHGLSELSLDSPVEYQFDQQLGFHIERTVPLHLRKKFLNMIGSSDKT
jgi:hypothetical protein